MPGWMNDTYCSCGIHHLRCLNFLSNSHFMSCNSVDGSTNQSWICTRWLQWSFDHVESFISTLPAYLRQMIFTTFFSNLQCHSAFTFFLCKTCPGYPNYKFSIHISQLFLSFATLLSQFSWPLEKHTLCCYLPLLLNKSCMLCLNTP